MTSLLSIASNLFIENLIMLSPMSLYKLHSAPFFSVHPCRFCEKVVHWLWCKRGCVPNGSAFLSAGLPCVRLFGCSSSVRLSRDWNEVSSVSPMECALPTASWDLEAEHRRGCSWKGHAICISLQHMCTGSIWICVGVCIWMGLGGCGDGRGWDG